MKHILIVLCIFVFAATVHAQAKSPMGSPQKYHFLTKTVLGGEGGWDYLSIDPLHRHLFIAHATLVEVYDIDHDVMLREITNTEGVHGVATAEPEGHGFISCGKSNSVLMFDLVTLDTIKRIPVGTGPDAIIYDPATKHIFVMNGHSSNITVLDAKSGAVITTIALPAGPEFAVSDEKGTVYVNIEDKSEIVKIDSRANKIVATWPVAPGEGPSGLAIDPKSGTLFSGCANQKLIVMNAKSGKIESVLPIGKGVDAVAFDPALGLAFSSNGEGNVTIVGKKAGEYSVLQTLETQKGARTIALDPKTHDIYVATADFGATPEATKDHPRPRPSILPGTFTILKYGRQ